MDCLGVLVFANGTRFNVRERIMQHQLAQEADGLSQIVGTIFKIAEVSTIKLAVRAGAIQFGRVMTVCRVNEWLRKLRI